MEHSKCCPNCKYEQPTKQADFCLKCRFPLMVIAGKYRLVQKLGQGGFGSVFLARHLKLRQRKRVIKVINEQLFEDQPKLKVRFQREIQMTAELSESCHHVVRIYDDFGDIPNLGSFYVMEHLEGIELSSLVSDRNKLPPLALCKHIFLQLCDTVQQAHDANIIHRDLKPQNLMLVRREGEDNYLKVFDFGIAKPTKNRASDGESLTMNAVGTPAYMAPEMFLADHFDHRVDLYAMGIILFELLTGRPPFVLDSNNETALFRLLQKHISEAPPSPRSLRPERRISPELEEVTLRALAKKPEARFQSAKEFKAALQRLSFQENASATSASSDMDFMNALSAALATESSSQSIAAQENQSGDVLERPNELHPQENQTPLPKDSLPTGSTTQETRPLPRRDTPTYIIPRNPPPSPNLPLSPTKALPDQAPDAPKTSPPHTPIPPAKREVEAEQTPDTQNRSPLPPPLLLALSAGCLVLVLVGGFLLLPSFSRPKAPPHTSKKPTPRGHNTQGIKQHAPKPRSTHKPRKAKAKTPPSKATSKQKNMGLSTLGKKEEHPKKRQASGSLPPPPPPLSFTMRRAPPRKRRRIRRLCPHKPRGRRWLSLRVWPSNAKLSIASGTGKLRKSPSYRRIRCLLLSSQKLRLKIHKRGYSPCLVWVTRRTKQLKLKLKRQKALEVDFAGPGYCKK